MNCCIAASFLPGNKGVPSPSAPPPDLHACHRRAAFPFPWTTTPGRDHARYSRAHPLRVAEPVRHQGNSVAVNSGLGYSRAYCCCLFAADSLVDERLIGRITGKEANGNPRPAANSCFLSSSNRRNLSECCRAVSGVFRMVINRSLFDFPALLFRPLAFCLAFPVSPPARPLAISAPVLPLGTASPPAIFQPLLASCSWWVSYMSCPVYQFPAATEAPQLPPLSLHDKGNTVAGMQPRRNQAEPGPQGRSRCQSTIDSIIPACDIDGALKDERGEASEDVSRRQIQISRPSCDYATLREFLKKFMGWETAPPFFCP